MDVRGCTKGRGGSVVKRKKTEMKRREGRTGGKAVAVNIDKCQV